MNEIEIEDEDKIVEQEEAIDIDTMEEFFDDEYYGSFQGYLNENRYSYGVPVAQPSGSGKTVFLNVFLEKEKDNASN